MPVAGDPRETKRLLGRLPYSSLPLLPEVRTVTEPSPSPIPTTPSGQSWLDWLGPLNHLWKEQPFVAFVITALVLPLAIWLGKRA